MKSKSEICFAISNMCSQMASYWDYYPRDVQQKMLKLMEQNEYRQPYQTYSSTQSFPKDFTPRIFKKWLMRQNEYAQRISEYSRLDNLESDYRTRERQFFDNRPSAFDMNIFTNVWQYEINRRNNSQPEIRPPVEYLTVQAILILLEEEAENAMNDFEEYVINPRWKRKFQE